MKLNKWLYGAAALAMLAACSDKDLSSKDDGGGNGKFETTPGEGYIGITLQLPEQPTTRALDDNHQNDRYDDGLPSEYNIKNAALLLFYGSKTDEENAQFVGAYKIDGPDNRFDKPSNDNITTSFLKTVALDKKITLASTNDQLWGLALVNYDETMYNIGANGALTISNQASKYDSATEANATEPLTNLAIKTTTTTGTKFSDFRLLVTSNQLYKEDNNGLNIFMTNAPLCNHPGEDANPNGQDGYVIQTLAPLDAEKIYTNIEDAKINSAGCIFVERAVAKVTIGEFPLKATIKYQELQQNDNGIVTSKGTPTDVNLKITSLGWMIDNEETSSYLVRNAKKGGLNDITDDDEDDIWDMLNNTYYRFVGHLNMAHNATFDNNSVHQKY